MEDVLIVLEATGAYREERRRIESDARRNRAGLERALADVLSRRTSLIDKMSRDLISDDEAALLLDNLRAEKARIDEELSVAAEDSNVIELHPKAVTRFKENSESLATILAEGEMPDAEIVGPVQKAGCCCCRFAITSRQAIRDPDQDTSIKPAWF